MFQKVLVVLDRRDFDPQVIQKAFALVQLHQARLALLHIITLQDSSPILLLSELDHQKDWAGTDLMVWNAWTELPQVSTAPAKLVRPKTKLKVAANVVTLEPPVFNHLENSSDSTTRQISTQFRSLGQAIADVAQLCKADLIVINPSQSTPANLAADVIHMAQGSVLTIR